MFEFTNFVLCVCKAGALLMMSAHPTNEFHKSIHTTSWLFIPNPNVLRAVQVRETIIPHSKSRLSIRSVNADIFSGSDYRNYEVMNEGFDEAKRRRSG